MSIRSVSAPRLAIDAQNICVALAHTPGIDGWQLEVVGEEEAQLYLLGEREEARRTVTNERARLVLHNDHTPHAASAGSRRTRGTTGLTLLGDDLASPERLATRLNDAVAMASLTDSPPYPLPGAPAGGFPQTEISDPALAGAGRSDLVGVLADLRERMDAALADQPGVRLSSAELYATRSHRELRNSRGLVGVSAGTRLSVDFVVIARDGSREAEIHAELRRRRLADLRLEETLAAYATFARDSLGAVMPATHAGPVVLSGEALPSLFAPLIFHTSAQAAYQRLSRYTLGEPITTEEPRGDRLTFASDALRPYGTRTAPFDDDGLPGLRVPIVEAGILRNRWADARYGAYLGVPRTGAFANVTLERGSWSLDALRSPEGGGTVYEIVAFSWLNPDPISGDFVAEIKLGYRHDARGTAPIKGGSLSGNLFTALADMRLAAESYSDGAYLGPAAIRFGALTLAGS